MAPRPSWKGHVRLSLISIPVEAYSVLTEGGGKLHFRQLHAECHTPIQYQKVCPVHGEVKADDIVMGYEYGDGKYALLDREELGKGSRDRTLTIDAFVAPIEVDPLYWDGSQYYLLPDGAIGQQSYAVLHRALAERDRWGVGEAVIGDKEQLMLLRPLEDMLCLTALHYASRVRAPETVSADRLDSKAPRAEEVRLAEMLIDAATPDKFDLAKYEDDYTQRMQQVIEAKIAGQDVAMPEVEEPPQVINLMDALKRSVANLKHTNTGGKTNGKADGKKASRAKPAKAPKMAKTAKPSAASAARRTVAGQTTTSGRTSLKRKTS